MYYSTYVEESVLTFPWCRLKVQTGLQFGSVEESVRTFPWCKPKVQTGLQFGSAVCTICTYLCTHFVSTRST